jgi:hypothetical protein
MDDQRVQCTATLGQDKSPVLIWCMHGCWRGICPMPIEKISTCSSQGPLRTLPSLAGRHRRLLPRHRLDNRFVKVVSIAEGRDSMSSGRERPSGTGAILGFGTNASKESCEGQGFLPSLGRRKLQWDCYSTFYARRIDAVFVTSSGEGM